MTKHFGITMLLQKDTLERELPWRRYTYLCGPHITCLRSGTGRLAFHLQGVWHGHDSQRPCTHVWSPSMESSACSAAVAEHTA